MIKLKDTEIKLKKDRECAECEHLFDCKGKPANVKRCLNFKEVKNEKNNNNHFSNYHSIK